MATVIGTDNVSPMYDPEGLWRMWAVWEIWIGQLGQGRHVPKIKDYVIDPETYEVWIVDHLDPISLIPTLRAIKPAGMTTTIEESDLIFGVGPSAQLDTYRAYLNDSIFPHVMSLDQRWMPKGSLVSYVKVFLGTDTSMQGEVISKVYDASNQFVSNAVQLEMVALESHTNYAVKIPKRFNVTTKIKNGERVTAVAYAADGMVLERRQFLVENTDVIQDVAQGIKYITDISLESIWLSASSADQLDYPLNIPMDSLNMTGVVHYSDGSKLKLPVDGSKFRMIGLEGRLSSIEDRPHPLVLTYSLSEGEQAYATTEAFARKITKPYKIKTINPNNSISVKLFGFPEWQNLQTGYRMRWFLLNMARNIFFDVTPYVTFSEATGPFNPMLYGIIQRKGVSINLRDVSGAFIPFIHPQSVDIVLSEPGENSQRGNWSVNTVSSDIHPRFGADVWGRKIDTDKINLACNKENLEDWLQSFYWRTYPLVNQAEENVAPTPTHFVVTLGNKSTVWPISDWDKDLNIATTVNAQSTVFIRFIKRTASGDMSLSYAAAMIKNY